MSHVGHVRQHLHFSQPRKTVCWSISTKHLQTYSSPGTNAMAQDWDRLGNPDQTRACGSLRMRRNWFWIALIRNQDRTMFGPFNSPLAFLRVSRLVLAIT